MINSLSLFIGLRYTLARSRSRAVSFMSRIAMTGVILGVALLIIVLSVMNGFDKELRERILAIMPQVTLYQSTSYHSTSYQNNLATIDDQYGWPQLRQQILQHEDIVAAAPFVELQAMLNVGKHAQPALIYGVDVELERTVSIIDTFMDKHVFNQLKIKKSGVILGRGLAEKMALKSGDTLNIIIPQREGKAQKTIVRRVVLSGVFDSGTEVDNALVLMNLSMAAELSPSPERVSGLHIKVKDFFSANKISSDLRSQLPPYYYTTDWTQTHGNIYAAVQMSRQLVSLLLFLIIGIAAFNVVSTLMMVVIDKESDIAILRTLGFTRRKIMMIFIIQGFVISAIGIIVGVVSGILLSLIMQDVIRLIEKTFSINFLQTDIYPISYLPVDIHMQDIQLIVIVTIIISLLASMYPALRAAQVEPADVLRYD